MFSDVILCLYPIVSFSFIIMNKDRENDRKNDQISKSVGLLCYTGPSSDGKMPFTPGNCFLLKKWHLFCHEYVYNYKEEELRQICRMEAQAPIPSREEGIAFVGRSLSVAKGAGIKHRLEKSSIRLVTFCENCKNGIKSTKSFKVSFNNVKSEMHGPTCYQCL